MLEQYETNHNEKYSVQVFEKPDRSRDAEIYQVKIKDESNAEQSVEYIFSGTSLLKQAGSDVSKQAKLHQLVILQTKIMIEQNKIANNINGDQILNGKTIDDVIQSFKKELEKLQEKKIGF